MKDFWNELKRRQIVKSAVAYLVVSWLIIQVLSILFPTFSFSPNALRMVIIFLAVLFPAWIIFNWIYEPSTQGLVKTDDTPDDSKGIEKKRISLNRVIIVGLGLAVVLLVINTFRLQSKIIRDTDGKSSIAVLYFDNMSSDEGNAWISDGMTESISSKLQPIGDLIVTGRTSVKQFKDSKEPIPEIAKKLGVSYILEGSVRVHNNRALITAQLIDKNDAHVWSREYNVVLDDILETQSTIAARIVDELKIKLSPMDYEQLKYGGTDNLEAYKWFLKGQAIIDNGEFDKTSLAFDYFKRATELDTLYAEAYAKMGFMTYFIHILDGKIDAEVAYKQIKAYSDKAISINPNTSLAYSILGLRLLLADKFDENLYKSYYEKALELNPNGEENHYVVLADYYYEFRGDIKKAQELITMGLRVSPFPSSMNWVYVHFMAKGGEVLEAEAHFEKTRKLYDDGLLESLLPELFLEKSKLTNKNEQDWMETIKIFKDSMANYLDHANANIILAEAYNKILNDDVNFLKYAKRAYKLDSTNLEAAICYIEALIENRMFKEAKTFMQSNNYNKVFREYDKKFNSLYYYYVKGEYDKCLQFFDGVGVRYQLLTYAQMGNLYEVNKIMAEQNPSNTYKAFAYAILKERDSMYHYLEKDNLDLEKVNSQFEFDPYRKDEHYKSLLKKHNLPITHWNE